MTTYNADEALIAKVKEVLNREDTVLFIGAGLSRWSGLPSWIQLLEELANFIELQGYSAVLVRKELAAKDLLQAASYGVDQLTSPQFGQFIRQACRVGTAIPHEIHKKIVNLGPRSFITTNYDRLIEESLNKWCSAQFFQVVSNKQLTETADIVQARATNFVFKPHGDVGDVDSIILSREQYRVLQGDRKHILQALETLLVSRPVVFIGFGLRDLDFFYVKDLLANTYKGGTIDHYAIMPDVSDQERTYWRKNYGIHILPYYSIETPSGGHDHTPLINLFDALLDDSSNVLTVIKENEPGALSEKELSANQILAVARYAARLISLYKVKTSLELPLQISISKDSYKSVRNFQWRFNGASVEEFLKSFGNNALLIGNPGAGKTYAFKKVSLMLANQLQDACLNDSVQIPQLKIPIYIDLKLYKGDVWQLAEQTLPSEISLELLIANKSVRVFLDSFNEMPREHFESGEFEKDFNAFIGRLEGCPIIIGSRTNEGLQKFNLPTFWLDEIDEKFVEEYISSQGDKIEGRFEPEIISLLKKPLFFKLYLEGKISVKGETHPHEVYRSLFQKLSHEFQESFNLNISIEIVLASIAYSAIEEGRETLIFAEVLSQLKYSFQQAGINVINEADFINWLISREILIPASGKRLTFFHQSITEYLAALEMAKLYKVAPQILERSLRFTRWDQAIFLTLGFLSEEETDRFIQQVLEADLSLGIRAAKFVEFKRDLVVLRILQQIQNKDIDESMLGFGYLMRALPVTAVHKDILRELQARHDDVGGAAICLLADIPGEISQSDLIEELFAYADDFNYCREVGGVLVNKLDSHGIKSIVAKLAEVQIEDEEEISGLTYGLQTAFEGVDISLSLPHFPPWQNLNRAQLEAFNDILKNSNTTPALSVSIDMILENVGETAITLYFQLKFGKGSKTINTDLFNKELLSALFKKLSHEKVGIWAIQAIKLIVGMRPDLSEVVKNQASQTSGVVKLVLLYCLSSENTAFWDEMQRISLLTNLDSEPLFLFQIMDDIDWKNKESELVKILKLHHTPLTRWILESLVIFGGDENETTISQDLITPIDYWLEWMNSEQSKDPQSGFWFCNRLGNFLVNYTSPETHALFIEEFNKNAIYRPILVRYILPNITNLTTDMLIEDSIQYLLSDLTQKGNPRDFIFGETSLLGRIATESFVQERLLPLLSVETEPLKSNLRMILRRAGQQHQRRYITETT